MQIKQWDFPKNLPEFEKTTCLLQVTHYNARVFLAHFDALSQLEDIHTEKAEKVHYSDHEGMSKKSTGGYTMPGMENNHLKQHMEKVFINYLIERIKFMHSQKMFQDLIIYTPADMKKQIEHKLPKNLQNRVRFVKGTFNYDTPYQLLDRLYVLK